MIIWGKQDNRIDENAKFLALRHRSARALRRAWHRGEQHPSARRRAALWWALEALRCYPSAADSERYAANMRARAALAEVPRG